MTTITDTRTMSLVDVPLVRRVSTHGIVLDSELGLTRDARGQHSLLLSSLVFPRGLYTLVARSANQQSVVGQFRYRPEDKIAHIVYLAPAQARTDDSLWLPILDAMAREAGKHGAQSLVAEVEIDSPLFETLRTARFATYARQTIWALSVDEAISPQPHIELAEECEADAIGILSLMSRTIPTLLHTVAAPPHDMDGLVYRQDGRVLAYIGVSEGRHGVYLLPYLDISLGHEAINILCAAIQAVDTEADRPIYICIRSYQQWLDAVLEDLNFERYAEQAVMVKQLVAPVKQVSRLTLRVHRVLEATPCLPHILSVTTESNLDKEITIIYE